MSPKAIIAFVLAVLAAPVPADIVTLANGDELAGEIRSLEDNTLVLEQIPELGVRELPWPLVTGIRTDRTYSVLTTGNERLEGRIDLRGAVFEIVGPGSVSKMTKRDVARIEYGRLKGTTTGVIDVGMSLTRGNQSHTQASTGFRTEYRSVRHRIAVRADSLFARQDDARPQSRHAAAVRADRYLNAATFAYALAGLERNERRDLDLRTQLGGGLGWQVSTHRLRTVSLLTGVDYVSERYPAIDGRRTAEGRFGLEWLAVFLRDARLLAQLSIHPDLVDRGRKRIQFDGSLLIPIAGRFTYTLRVFNRFDSRPAAVVRRGDYGVVTGLGVAFR